MSTMLDKNANDASDVRHAKDNEKSNNSNIDPQNSSWRARSSHIVSQTQREAKFSNRPYAQREWRMHNQLHAAGNNSKSVSFPDLQDNGIGSYRRATFPKKDKESAAVIRKQRQDLPIFAHKQQLLEKIKEHQTVIVVGKTASGKTTQIPQYLVEEGYARKGKIVCTQPRRVAAVSIANRVVEECRCFLGKEVGYKIRFENRTYPKTKIIYMTDGMLLRELCLNLQIDEYSIIMLDEAHERTVNTDVLLTLLKQALQQRKDLKLIVSSATLQATKFSEYFNDAPIFEIMGHPYPVKISYNISEEDDTLVDSCVKAVLKIHETEPWGDILVFLPGKFYINPACYKLKDLNDPSLIILPLYAHLPPKEQEKVFIPTPEKHRKVVIATNIAETSITIDGISYVVDCGYCKLKFWNVLDGMNCLKLIPISRAQAEQRAGRAGRTCPGVCYRLYTEEFYQETMSETNPPEIQRISLANIALSLKAMGINDLLSLDWMDPPNKEVVDNAYKILHDLGALSVDGELTDLGRTMNCFPLEPSLSKILLSSVDLKCSDECLTIVSMITDDNPFYRPKDGAKLPFVERLQFHHPQGDHLTYLRVYEAWQNNNFCDKWCRDRFLNSYFLRIAFETRRQLMGIMRQLNLEISRSSHPMLIQKAILSGYTKNLARWDPLEGVYIRQIDNRRLLLLPCSSVFIRKPEWIVYHDVLSTTCEFMSKVTVVEKDWLDEGKPCVQE